jgi:hypothetical protein
MRIERALVGLLFLATTVATGCGRLAYNLPPGSRLMEPGPGVGGPGPGVIPPAGSAYGIYGGAVGRYGDGMGGAMGPCGPYCASMPLGASMPPGARGASRGPVMQASYNCPCDPSGACTEGCPCDGSCPCGCADGGPCGCEGACGCGPGCGGGGAACVNCGFFRGGCGCMRPGTMEAYADGAGYAGIATSQIAFLGDDGVQVSWDVSGAGMFDSTPLVIPGRQDFYQGAIYRLKLTKIPGRAGVQLYPTLEIAPVTPRTDAYLAHSPIPVQFTEEDFDQVVSGNFVTKVIYLPDPEFQELALAGVETLVSTRLDPGVDPIAEADRRGSILAIVRMGNKDLELGAGSSGQPTMIVPASHEEEAQRWMRSTIPGKQASYSPQGDRSHLSSGDQENQNQPAGNGVSPAQYCDEGDPACECGPSYAGGPCGPYGDGSMGNMPVGMPTSGFAPTAVPPNMVAGAPQWGMPITGTPIGLPGPPHVPLGVPAGLQKHVIKNRTKVVVPPPVTKMEMSVKQRPGLNYPRPDDHVYADETQREPFRLVPSWLTGIFHHHNSCEYGPCPQ